MNIGAIIPLKNERGNVKDIVYAASVTPLLNDIIFIEANSIDKTFESVIEWVDKYDDNRMSVMKQTPPYTKFEAIKQASKRLNSDHILIWDGDNTIEFTDIQKMLSIYISTSAKNDFFLVANRITKDRESGSFRVINFIGNYFFSFLMFPILGLRLPDVLSGAKIFPKKIINDEKCSSMYTKDQFGDITLLSYGRKNNLNFLSVPVKYNKRSYGKSSISRFKGGYNMIKLIIHLRVHRCYNPTIK